MLNPNPDLSNARWFKSSLSTESRDCVEVAHLADGRTVLRHSKDPAGPVLTFTPAEWRAFVGGARLGEFDRP